MFFHTIFFRSLIMLTVLENKKGLFVEFEGNRVKVGGLLSTNMKLLLDKENGYEVDSVSKLISKPLKEKLKCDAINLNFLKRTSRAKLLI